jgi:predicted nucleic acid-binding protein
LGAGDSPHGLARQALDEALGRSLVISGTVYAELLGAPRRSEVLLDKFCEAGIGVEWELSEHIWKAAGRAFQSYATRRKKLQERAPGILADFLIGAHALVNGYKLLTLDAGTYRVSFPKCGLGVV